jgi:hypothetical protein
VRLEKARNSRFGCPCYCKNASERASGRISEYLGPRADNDAQPWVAQIHIAPRSRASAPVLRRRRARTRFLMPPASVPWPTRWQPNTQPLSIKNSWPRPRGATISAAHANAAARSTTLATWPSATPYACSTPRMSQPSKVRVSTDVV